MIPEKVAHYRIISKLGAGGMGEVYLAEDLNLGRHVALKLLPAKFTQDLDRVRRFAQEARAASTLNHPNILTIYEIGEAVTEASATHFIAMEFVEGHTLRHCMGKQLLPVDQAIEIAAQIAAALTAAHSAGITHRDIKPENVMLRSDDYIKVLDFGLAKLTENSPFNLGDPGVTQAETVGLSGADFYATLPLTTRCDTSPGVVLGTVSYMSPEQARGIKVDARTDIFSLGIVLYEMVTGRLPFEGATTADLMVAILEREPQPIARYAPKAPDQLSWIVAKMLAKDREDRYQAAKGLLNDLRHLQKQLKFASGSYNPLGSFGSSGSASGNSSGSSNSTPSSETSNSADSSGGSCESAAQRSALQTNQYGPLDNPLLAQARGNQGGLNSGQRPLRVGRSKIRIKDSTTDPTTNRMVSSTIIRTRTERRASLIRWRSCHSLAQAEMKRWLTCVKGFPKA